MWALCILLAALICVPQSSGSIPARLQAAAAAAAHGTMKSSRQRPADTESTPRAPAAEPAEIHPPLDSPALEGPTPTGDNASIRLEPATDDTVPALEPVPLESPIDSDSEAASISTLDSETSLPSVTTPAGGKSGDTPRSKLLAPSPFDTTLGLERTPGRSVEPPRSTDDEPAPGKKVPGKTVPGKPNPATAVPQEQGGRKPSPSNEAPASQDASAKPAKSISPEMAKLRNRIRTCLSYYYQHPTSVDERSPWGIMHSLIAFGVDTELVASNKRVNAIGWICFNRPCKGMTLMTVKDGELAMRGNGPGYQGHDGQLLSMLALSGVQSNYPIRVDGHEFTVADLVAYEQKTCKPKSELTFQLIGLSHYLPSDATWESEQGEEWSIRRLIREELAQPIAGAACGGTHRLIGLSMAVKTRQKRGEPMEGEWLRAQKFVQSYQQHAFKLQNRDGSFSTSWLEKRDDSGDIDRRIQTTGHILEWLIFSLPEKDLSDPRLVRGVNYLTTTLFDNEREWEIGPRGHALRALALYNERVFGDKPGARRELLARRPGK